MYFTNIRYTDDTMLMTNPDRKLEEFLHKVVKASMKKGLLTTGKGWKLKATKNGKLWRAMSSRDKSRKRSLCIMKYQNVIIIKNYFIKLVKSDTLIITGYYVKIFSIHYLQLKYLSSIFNHLLMIPSQFIKGKTSMLQVCFFN